MFVLAFCLDKRRAIPRKYQDRKGDRVASRRARHRTRTTQRPMEASIRLSTRSASAAATASRCGKYYDCCSGDWTVARSNVSLICRSRTFRWISASRRITVGTNAAIQLRVSEREGAVRNMQLSFQGHLNPEDPYERRMHDQRRTVWIVTAVVMPIIVAVAILVTFVIADRFLP
jgi:hypothetical protein